MGDPPEGGDVLAGSWLKLARAVEHTDVVEERWMEFGRQEHIDLRLNGRFEPATEEWVVTAGGVPELPSRWAAIVGDAVHNYRSALDHLVYVLSALGTGGDPGERTAFPAAWSRRNYESAQVQDVLLEGLSDTHRHIIDGFQPYKLDSPDEHPVAVLVTLSNDDKHRVLQPALMVPSAGDIQIERTNCDITSLHMTNIIGVPLENDMEAMRIQLANVTGQPDVKITGGVNIYMGFRNGLPALETLRRFAHLVASVLVAAARVVPADATVSDDLRFGRLSPQPQESTWTLYGLR